MAGLIVARVCLGVFEAGFGPGIPLYFCEYAAVIENLDVLLNIWLLSALLSQGGDRSSSRILVWR